jgi:tripartite-type tricarboxylate transporter receptor subunit TctC
MSHDLLKDFEPVAQVPGNPMLIVTKKAVPAKTLKKLVAWLKANQEKDRLGPQAVAARRSNAAPSPAVRGL